MAIDYSKLRSLTARQIVSALLADGFFLRSQRGSHRRYYHPDGRRVTVPFHSSSGTFVPKTLRSILEEQAGWAEDDLKRLRLLPWQGWRRPASQGLRPLLLRGSEGCALSRGEPPLLD
jgi:predicted RNA binding protein YcfA (HicA-like mRNA interferase family)